MPMDNYIITVEESKNYQGSKKTLDLLNEKIIQPSFNLFIDLKPQYNSFVELTLENESGKKITQATVTAILLSTNEPIEVLRNYLIINSIRI